MPRSKKKGYNERDIRVAHLLSLYGSNKLRAAEILGVSHTTVIERIRGNAEFIEFWRRIFAADIAEARSENNVAANEDARAAHRQLIFKAVQVRETLLDSDNEGVLARVSDDILNREWGKGELTVKHTGEIGHQHTVSVSDEQARELESGLARLDSLLKFAPRQLPALTAEVIDVSPS